MPSKAHIALGGLLQSTHPRIHVAGCVVLTIHHDSLLVGSGIGRGSWRVNSGFLVGRKAAQQSVWLMSQTLRRKALPLLLAV